MKKVLTLLSLISISFAKLSVDEKLAWAENKISNWERIDHKAAWVGWKETFNKKYLNVEEEAHRFNTFLENWHKIHEHNMDKNSTYKLKLNQFGDLKGDEFKYYVHGHTGSCKKSRPSTSIKTAIKMEINNKKTKLENLIKDVPTSIDWTTKGVVTPVKDQGSCGSCWAFSTTGSVESRYAIATGSLTSLSEQELVDCSNSYGNDGCDGGLMDYAFEYVRDNKGLCSEADYGYLGVDSQCKSSSCTHYDPISGYTDVTSDSETSLQTAVAAGPVSVAIEADQFAFQFYTSGILTGTCGTSLDHGVLAVGYGSDNGQDYWKVKNSWGTTWGEEGYVLICRNCNKNGDAGECGILEEPSYPTI